MCRPCANAVGAAVLLIATVALTGCHRGQSDASALNPPEYTPSATIKDLMQGIVDPWLAPGDIVELWTAPLVQPTYTYDMFSSFESVHAGLARTDDEQ